MTLRAVIASCFFRKCSGFGFFSYPLTSNSSVAKNNPVLIFAHTKSLIRIVNTYFEKKNVPCTMSILLQSIATVSGNSVNGNVVRMFIRFLCAPFITDFRFLSCFWASESFFFACVFLSFFCS